MTEHLNYLENILDVLMIKENSMEFKQHKFYDVSKLSFDEKHKILLEAHDICNGFKVYILKSLRRESIEMSFEEVMIKFNNACAFRFLKRSKNPFEIEHGEVMFRTMTTEYDYFLWINITIKNLEVLAERHNLKLFSYE